ncbi:unnamed protein product [Effrenium voratum]|nr:unnamed protein product [Effrenium voratum]
MAKPKVWIDIQFHEEAWPPAQEKNRPPSPSKSPRVTSWHRLGHFKAACWLAWLASLGSCLSGLLPLAQRDFFDQEAEPRFAVVVDAGSTGTRSHVYCFSSGLLRGQGPICSGEVVRTTKPGLGTCADRDCLSLLLTPLLDAAVQSVPARTRATIPLAIRATAGFRMLKQDMSDFLMEEIRAIARSYGFQDAGVEVMSGDDEGSLQWVAVNSLIGAFREESPVAVLDLGGASTQIAYAIADLEQFNSEQISLYSRTLMVPGDTRELQIFEHSFLGFGIVAARAKIMEEAELWQLFDKNPCIPLSAEVRVEHRERVYAGRGSGDLELCVQLITRILKPDNCAEDSSARCSFATVWLGPG